MISQVKWNEQEKHYSNNIVYTIDWQQCKNRTIKWKHIYIRVCMKLKIETNEYKHIQLNCTKKNNNGERTKKKKKTTEERKWKASKSETW